MTNYTKHIVALATGVCILLCISCVSRIGQPFVHQRIPIEVQGDKVVVLEMHGLAGSHMVGIRCSPELWDELTNCQKGITVRLKSADTQPAEVFAIEPGRARTTCDQVASCRYFFAVSATGNVVVEISFPKMTIVGPAEIIICKTPEQTELP